MSGHALALTHDAVECVRDSLTLLFLANLIGLGGTWQSTARELNPAVSRADC
jgi:hypothetical protein